MNKLISIILVISITLMGKYLFSHKSYKKVQTMHKESSPQFNTKKNHLKRTVSKKIDQTIIIPYKKIITPSFIEKKVNAIYKLKEDTKTSSNQCFKILDNIIIQTKYSKRLVEQKLLSLDILGIARICISKLEDQRNYLEYINQYKQDFFYNQLLMAYNKELI